LTQDAATTANFSVVASGSGSLTYQWKKGASNLSNGAQGSGSTVSGATSADLTIASIRAGDAESYTCVVSGVGSPATSSVATLTVTPLTMAILTPTDAANFTNNAGTTRSFSVTDNSYGFTTTYQWKKGGANLANGSFDNAATVSGATSANLTLTGVTGGDSGDYTCAVTNTVNSTDATSPAQTLYVIDPAINTQPVSFTAQCGATTNLSVNAGGTTNLYYQWYTPDPSGTAITDATNATLAFSPLSFANAGSYTVVVTNIYGAVTSVVATVTVIDTIAPVITVNGPGVVSTNIECHGGAYSDPGASANDSCAGSVSVSTSGSVNSDAVGNYTLTYTSDDGNGNTNTATRVVHVIDTINPVVTLNGSASVNVECHTSFSDPGATADDSCAGSLSVSTSGSLNINVPGDYTLTYSATDPSSNSGSTTRTIHVVDTTAPSFTLTGGASINWECHTTFTDPGVTADGM
jgi:hypothetical protein